MPSLLKKPDPAPAPESKALEPVRRKVKKLDFKRLARLVSEDTDGFGEMLGIAKAIARSNDVEPKDRLKAIEFLGKWTEANPAVSRQNVVMSGPDGKPIQVAHAHAHALLTGGASPRDELTRLTDGELAEMKRIVRGALERRTMPALPPAGDVIDVEVDDE